MITGNFISFSQYDKIRKRKELYYQGFIFIVILGFTQIQVTYTVSTMSNTLINVTLNTYDAVDSAMSDTSTNPVQNKVIKSYVDNLVGNIETVLQTINSGSGV